MWELDLEASGSEDSDTSLLYRQTVTCAELPAGVPVPSCCMKEALRALLLNSGIQTQASDAQHQAKQTPALYFCSEELLNSINPPNEW